MIKPLSSSVLTWLRCFDSAARHESFTRAAAELNVTQGSVSQQVKKLEEHLGVELFIRGGRQLSLTAAGVELAEITAHSFHTLALTVNRFKSKNQGVNTIKLSCSPSFALMWLTPRLNSFLRDNPQLSIRVQGEFHHLDRFRMENEDVQGGIRFDPGGYKETRAVSFMDEWLVPVCSPEFLEAHPELVDSTEIPTQYLLHDSQPWAMAPLDIEWSTWLKGVGFSYESVENTGTHFNLSQLALAAAFSNQGIAIGRLALVLDDLLSGRLVTPYKQVVRSLASYYFLSANTQNKNSALLENWLLEESARFKAYRKQAVKELGLRLLG
ncbi:MAG TPA: LysR family transcriptional regulator [Alcaligenaceae bacterium]|nr:LysR family transcriptional regulator [Alcaligenaceae bacterium]